MPRPARLPFLIREKTRHGKIVWYFRRGANRRTRLYSDYGTREFQAEYDAALGGLPAPVRGSRLTSGSLFWALSLYRQSPSWRALSKATRRQRDSIFSRVCEKNGREPLSGIDRRVIQQSCDTRASTPSAASNFLNAMKGFFAWAVDEDFVQTDPTVKIKVAKRPNSGGFPAWSEEDIAHFEATYPIGTRERLAFDVLLYTGLRRGDAVRFGPEHIQNGFATMKTEKTGTMAYIPIEPELQKSIEAGPCGSKTFIAGVLGKPRVKEAFGNWFHDLSKAIGIDKSCHGVRKAAANRDAMRGWTEAELEAKYSWHGGQMAARYTRSVNRRKLALNAARRAVEASEALASRVQKRRSARIILLDEQKRILMNRSVVPTGASAFHYWAPPGTDVGTRETELQAANRALSEELNLNLKLEGPVHIASSRFDRGEILVENTDVFFVGRIGAFSLPGEDEASRIASSAWWSLDDLRGTTETVFPLGLEAVLRQASL